MVRERRRLRSQLIPCRRNRINRRAHRRLRYVVRTYTYEPFGRAVVQGQTSTGFAFTGRELDAAGVYFYRTRYYNPNLDRFASEDPIGLNGGINGYAYTGDDPLGWTDPLGFRRVQVCRQPLKRLHGLIGFEGHTYIRIINDDDTETTYGILGDIGSTKNQRPRKDDPRNAGRDCTDVHACEGQIDTLVEALERAYQSGTCPSCGDNYRAWFAGDLANFFDGYNSNTWVCNMIQGAGITPPSVTRAPGYHDAPGDWYPQ